MTTFDKNIPTEELLVMLAGARQNEANYKQVTQNIIANAKATDYYQEADALARAEATLIEDLTTEIKARALADYDVHQNKNPFKGVTIKVFKVFGVIDNDAMEKWVETNLAAAVKKTFDIKLIETFAKSSPVPGTEVIEEPRAEISSKLP